MKPLYWIIAFGLLASCTSRFDDPAISPLSVSTADACHASSYEYLTGRDATALERVYILGPVRVIRPGDAVTRDLRPARLNFQTGDDGRIARVFCG